MFVLERNFYGKEHCVIFFLGYLLGSVQAEVGDVWKHEQPI